METIARVKTPKRVCKVVQFVDCCGVDSYQLWDGQRRREWRIYTTPDEAIKVMLQRAAGDYMQTNMFNPV